MRRMVVAAVVGRPTRGGRTNGRLAAGRSDSPVRKNRECFAGEEEQLCRQRELNVEEMLAGRVRSATKSGEATKREAEIEAAIVRERED
ncbi:hypothetical protein BHE74_00049596 [Ensete ventricosum]|uniref:Uncharacterized protein n=1 Tax=Ensete ventricosum TaxID=4639 RepID=A0A444D9X2_ENSVE|nr:hypothetical protein B296_00012578 [Ensete ventricosum]RWV94973.1 hypothetical protein GW17_00042440 [Ensete ventricosum]RWW44624.1 hypothetical protein BHE74_00049596 [Ensete ventricosum]RZR71147.1 hypothetical protein BHM03_00003870 [Ensete ventricosum]